MTATASVRLALAALLGAGCAGPELSIGADRVGGLGLCQSPGLDPTQLAALTPTGRSHWLQPWKAFEDTWPAARMRTAIGISIGSDAEDPARLALLAGAGFTRAIAELTWASADWDDPTRLATSARDDLRVRLRGLRAAGLRPTLLVHAHEGVPGPVKFHSLRVMELAPLGATRVRIDKIDLPSVVVGRTGFHRLTKYKASEVIITATEPDGLVTLSKPLPVEVQPGAKMATTLKFAPFFHPVRADGSANPDFEETLRGWLAFVRAAVREAAAALGDSDFDLEVWNEVASGSDFLDAANYHAVIPPHGAGAPADVIPRVILERTVKALRDPAAGLPRLRIGDGFANTRWSAAAATAVVGVDAVDRHVSVQALRSADLPAHETAPLDARGRAAGVALPDGRQRDRFTPSYEIAFPELFLTALLPVDGRRPGQIVRDLAPSPTRDAQGTVRGRGQGPAGAPPPLTWITAMSTQPPKTPGATSADNLHFQAKAVLRSLSAYVGKGAEGIFFYNPSNELALIDRADPTGGEVLRALARFTNAFAGPSGSAPARSLSLAAVGSCAGARQFDGDGTPAHPALLDREVVAFFPFQIDARRFVASTYVMTRNLRPDLTAAPFDLVIDGVDLDDAAFAASDPLTAAPVPVEVVSRASNRVVVRIPLTDSPRLLLVTTP